MVGERNDFEICILLLEEWEINKFFMLLIEENSNFYLNFAKE